MPRPPRQLMTSGEFAALADRLGHPKPASPDVLGGVALVREGVVVSVGDVPAAPGLPAGVLAVAGASTPFRLNQWTESSADWVAVNDRIEIDVHGSTSMTHLDTTAHFSWEGRSVQTDADPLLTLAATGIVGRGILIDVPGVLGMDATGQVITLADVQEVLARTGAEPRRGDILHFSFGRTERARSDRAIGSVPTAGLSIECVEWLAGIGPSAVVTDEGLDSSPSEVEGQPVPWHLLLLTVLGIPLVDRAILTRLARTCAALGRWEFFSILSPLPIPGASGAPLNPLALF